MDIHDNGHLHCPAPYPADLGVWTYNRLVKTRNQVNEAWAGIDVQLQRRYDLVPNLLATVKGYMKHESGVLERVTRLRGNPEMELTERADQESGLSRSIGRLFAIAEDYPDLKASEGFAQLHDSLVEDRRALAVCPALLQRQCS